MTAATSDRSRSVGIRQLKAELSKHLRLVESGETVEVTDRGRVIARIHPALPTASDDPALRYARALLAAGHVSWSGRRLTAPDRTARLRGTATVSAAVIEDRR